MKKTDEFMILNEEDWSFAGEDTKYLTHGFHPYPARMIPQIANRLITRYSKPGDLVLDPFCGSGGVLVEARLLGRNSVGIDINPLAIIIARAKTTPINPKLILSSWRELKEKIGEDIRSLRFREFDVEPLRIPNISYWFKPQVAKELTIIRHFLDGVEDSDLYHFFATCFSVTVREVSNLRTDEFKIYRLPPEKLEKHNPNVFQIFVENVEERIRRMAEFYGLAPKDVACDVLLGDSRKLPLKNGSVDLVVTSPPYGDSRTTVAYGQFSKFSSLWLGLDENIVTNVDKISLGGGLRKFKNLPSETLHTTIEEISRRSKERARETLWYFTDLFECLEQLHGALRRGGYCCFVVGNRTVRRVQVPTDKIIVELGENLGFKHITTIYRRIPSKRMPWENAPENIPGERCKTISGESIVILAC
ncbi:MAG: DNA methyltransferase [archaeon YNP-LCB-003-016]|uniref:DNA methyltransferase n=1 Tax=Candidatus Culexarchaeum yellowstonense TaxID=2928963 RepID=UPI0026EF48F5|nr:DNA methyltransferase [Candidatus Culexarchaeum yellowstonense]MCR6691415.1 DNA methyltransferase [Candidatus Culexarchaeum yellowstonense]